jgi:hypothetical protein
VRDILQRDYSTHVWQIVGIDAGPFDDFLCICDCSPSVFRFPSYLFNLGREWRMAGSALTDSDQRHLPRLCTQLTTGAVDLCNKVMKNVLEKEKEVSRSTPSFE